MRRLVKRARLGNLRIGLTSSSPCEAARAFAPRLEKDQIGDEHWTGRLVTILPEQRRQLKDGYILKNVGFEYDHATRTQTLLLKKLREKKG